MRFSLEVYSQKHMEYSDKRQSYISESLYNIIEMQNDYM